MEIKRFYGSKVGDKIILTDREFFHCAKVTRHKPGYSLICCTGDGIDYYCTIDEITSNSVLCTVDRKEDNLSETKSSLVLCQALCKEFDFVVQKAVELGVTEIVPYTSERTNVKKFSLERTENIVLDAAKQCGRATLPLVHDVVDFNNALQLGLSCENKVLCYELERNLSINNIIEKNKSTVIFIGSEGGFSEKEVDIARSLGFRVATLGRRILRVETAAISALVLTLDALGDIC